MIRVARSVDGGWFVLWPWDLRGTRSWLIVSVGRFELVVRRGSRKPSRRFIAGARWALEQDEEVSR